MKLAWFRPDEPLLPPALDDSAALVTELRSTHEIDVFTAANASDFVELQAQSAYDASVFELDDTPAHAFIWPYLLRHGGVLHLRTLNLHQSRAMALFGAQRAQDYRAEFTFNHGAWPGQSPNTPPAYPGDWPMLRVPVSAASVVVVSQTFAAEQLGRTYPETRVRLARTGVIATNHSPASPGDARAVHGGEDIAVVFGTIPNTRLEVMRRAVTRARDAGAQAALIEAPPEQLLQEADVIVVLRWLSHGEPQTLALSAMAAGKPLVVFESAAAAQWPALDPQTWQRRIHPAHDPIAVSIDPRDEEHSLVLAIRRLSAEAELRRQLGQAARNWWQAHATPQHAGDDWRRVLEEAAALPPLSRPADWPAHLATDDVASELGAP